jgi:hypothetical protein
MGISVESMGMAMESMDGYTHGIHGYIFAAVLLLALGFLSFLVQHRKYHWQANLAIQGSPFEWE